MKRYKQVEARTKFSPEQVKNTNIQARRFVKGAMNKTEHESFIWDLLRMLDALGTLKSDILGDQ